MIDISNKCVFSGKTDDLTLTMTINVNGEDWKIAVSTEHEDTATPGAIKKLILSRLNELEEIKTKADMLGMMLVPKNQLTAKPQPTSQLEQAKSVPPTRQQQATKTQQTRLQQTKSQSSEPTRSPQEVLQEMANSITKHTIQQVTAPSGRPLTLPKTEISKAGTTEFKIISTSNKELIDRTVRNQENNLRGCGMCDGTGMKGTADCLSCKGRGVIG